MPHRRDILKQLAATGALGASGLLQQVLAAGVKPVPPGMHKITGAVLVNGQPARADQLVNAGDTVSTGAGAEAIYVIGQDAYLQRENSRVAFGDNLAAAAFRIVTGKLLAVFGKGDKKIRTATATIGIRGTGCYIEAEAARTYFCLCYGSVELQPDATPGQSRRYATTHHDQPYWIAAAGEEPVSPARVINHSDAELILLENLCGRWPPFNGAAGVY